ncbi:unnamed protein product [Colias eurytheme]|nr:unnamed protein product [Colias eurytheme]
MLWLVFTFSNEVKLCLKEYINIVSYSKARNICNAMFENVLWDECRGVGCGSVAVGHRFHRAKRGGGSLAQCPYVKRTLRPVRQRLARTRARAVRAVKVAAPHSQAIRDEPLSPVSFPPPNVLRNTAISTMLYNQAN